MVRLLVSSTALALASPAFAQAVAPDRGASSADARAQREADKVFQWIRIHSDKPRKAAVVPVEKPAPVPVRAVSRPARPAEARPVDTAAAPAVAPRVEAVAPSATEAAVAVPPAPMPSATAPAAAPEVDELLTLVHKTEPEFSPNLMRSLRRGMVQVGFTVQPDGSVAKAHVVSATHPRLGQAAVDTVSQWRFQPVKHAQAAVVDLGFNLD
jgi:protein TonB